MGEKDLELKYYIRASAIAFTEIKTAGRFVANFKTRLRLVRKTESKISFERSCCVAWNSTFRSFSYVEACDTNTTEILCRIITKLKMRESCTDRKKQ